MLYNLSIKDSLFINSQMNWQNDKASLLNGIYKESVTDNGAPVALFDIDGTVIRPKNGRKFPRDGDDWEFTSNVVVKRLRKLVFDEGYHLVLVSNQSGLSAKKDSGKLFEWKRKLGDMAVAIGAPCHVLASLEDDRYRKPATGMVGHVIGDLSHPKSFMCGDAAGRNGDFADTDRKFAINLGLSFHTPEEFFAKEVPKPYKLSYPDIDQLVATPCRYLEALTSGWEKKKQTLYINVGFPGSGKSRFSSYYLEPMGAIIVNQDKLKTLTACKDAAKVAIANGQSTVIDNTNLTAETRAEWIKLANELGVHVVCFHFTTPMEICRHNISYRANHYNGLRVHRIALATMAKRYVPPEKTEGFFKIVPVEFSAMGVSGVALQRYHMYGY
jgi:bifunctional polynucleotide phosphatase/kinase